uniref:pectinesterase n=1 Tax=Nelumbo nucifera TaxID=4432 RepID=A0A822ZAE1_NELNU|nr:TPA_asm: hypothetical protein HUJ06_014738 [Nelumbo nucifera]
MAANPNSLFSFSSSSVITGLVSRPAFSKLRVDIRLPMLSSLFLLILLFEGAPSSVSLNGTNGTVIIQEGYLNWIKQMGSLTHSLYNKAENKLKPCLTITVDKDPKKGDFVTVQKAVDSLPIVNQCRVLIKIHAGIYREKVDIPATKAFVTLEGAGADRTILQWGDTADRMGSDRRPLGTFASATFAINSPYFVAKNITFKTMDFDCKPNGLQ